MKKLTLLFLFLLTMGSIFHACDNSKTYAEQLEDEKKAISKFLKENNIKTISVSEFEKDTITNVDENEYVAFSNGVYMQIVNRGDGDTIKSRDEILVRFLEYDIMEEDTTVYSNIRNPYADYLNLYPVNFYYTKTSSTIYGQFLYTKYQDQGVIELIDSYWGLQVPAGWLYALTYIRSGAHIKLIVPSKMGHSAAQQDVIPNFYDIVKLEIQTYM